MLGIGLAEGIDAGQLNSGLLERGFVANAPRADTLRLLPPFVLEDDQATAAVAAIDEVLATLKGGTGEA